jgi:[glutamine synthetase] adenylyltransferase / [glutamine synthetase]-adenylyl-L-tyrosine phosphorylase
MKTDIPSFDICLDKSLRCSRYAQRTVHAEPAIIDELRTSYQDPIARSQMLARADSLPIRDESELKSILRKLRQNVLMRTLLRDLNGLAELDEVVSVTSDLAEIAIHSALTFHTRVLQAAYGVPVGASSASAQELMVVGMGKLGGRELNVSSDIDLVFVYGEEGKTEAADGSVSLSNHDFFTRLGQKVIAALNDITADGFVFRVDMRLRPFGDSGPLAVNAEGLEHYFVTSAQPWERYAWLKARAITGNAAELDALTRPFVYRKYHDYGALQDLRDLHAKIRAEAQRRNRLGDIKVGPGGIREIEFIVQLFQLIRGGRETRLQTCSTREAIARIAERGLLSPDSAASLNAAYAFLRNLEHRLQYLDDAQTQALPAGDADRAVIAEAMGYADAAGFDTALEQHRSFVSREFDALFASPGEKQPAVDGQEPQGQDKVWHAEWLDKGGESDALLAHLERLGYVDTMAIAECLQQWRQSSRYRFLTEKARTKLDRLIPAALQACAAQDVQAATFLHVFDVLQAVDRRDAYLSLLTENPGVLGRVARLAAKSAWAADLLKRHPILLDELLQARAHSAAVDWLQERARLEEDVLAADDDTERQYDLLRHFKQVHTLRLNIADVEGTLSVMALADELSALADLLLDVALALAWRSLVKERALCTPPGFAVIGYGKLGSKELGYASDLDLIFLFDPAMSPGPEVYIRLAQRFNQWLTALTSGGALYETDLRLRPDGASGLLVTSLDAFRDYQLQRAWTWEHQALTRARFCAGDRSLAARFDAVREAILMAPRDNARLREDILAMRAKMRAEHPERGERLNLKNIEGGIIDLEFIVQYLVLAHSKSYPALVRNAGNFALLHLAGEAGLVSRQDAGAAAQAYLAFRARQHLARNNNENQTLIGKEELRPERDAVKKLWDTVLG